MSEGSAEALMYEIIARKEEIDKVAVHLIEVTDGVFEAVSLGMPKFEPPELGFLRLVSWLFVLYHETGRVGVNFLTDRLAAYAIDPDGKLGGHPAVVRDLRTFSQHNLDPRKGHDSGVQAACEGWLKEHCGTPVPGNDTQWRACLYGLLREACAFLAALLAVARKIEQDESRDQICREWTFRIRKHYPPHIFDALISSVAADMGREHIDAARLRNRYYDKWTRALDLLDSDHNLETEARKLIEYVLLTDATPVLPITGKDIMEEFGIAPGPNVGHLLEHARRIYECEPCSRSDLLGRLRDKLGIQPGEN